MDSSAGADAPPPSVVVTVSGPLAPGEMPAGAVLCHSWLLNDQSSLLDRTPPSNPIQVVQPEPGDRVELGNLLAMRRWPLHALHNLHLSPADALREIGGPFKHRYSGALLVVSTPRKYWAEGSPADRASALLQLSRDTGVRIVAGTAPAPGCPASVADLDREVAGLVSDLAAGFPESGSADGRVLPGFLGELSLWDEANGPMPEGELLALRACVEAQRRSGAPLLLSGPVSEQVYALLDGVGVAEGSPGSGGCLWGRCAFFDVPPSSRVPPAQLAARGAFLGFCPPPAAADVAWEAYPGRRPWRTEQAFLDALAEAPAGQALVGSGLRFRTDTAASGGAGLAHVPSLFASPEVPQPSAAALRCAALAFLQYPWRPPAPPEEVIHHIFCYWCGKKKLMGEHFSKMTFDYCAPKCINAHRKVDYAPEKNEANS